MSWLWTPCTMAVASSPASQGSSETYSKFLPQSGERFMLMPGPRTTDTPMAAASRPRASPTLRKRSSFQDEPRADAVGKHVAGTLVERPRWSASRGWARSPCGPSDTMIRGTPSRSTGAVYQKADPITSDAFSSRVNSGTSAVRLDGTSGMAVLLGESGGGFLV